METDSGNIICPFCEFEETYQGDPLGEDETSNEVCSNCGKEYFIVCKISCSHHSRKYT